MISSSMLHSTRFALTRPCHVALGSVTPSISACAARGPSAASAAASAAASGAGKLRARAHDLALPALADDHVHEQHRLTAPTLPRTVLLLFAASVSEPSTCWCLLSLPVIPTAWGAACTLMSSLRSAVDSAAVSLSSWWTRRSEPSSSSGR